MMRQYNLDLAQLRQLGSPSVLLGTPDEMCEQLLRRRERLGISYLNCSAEMMDAMANYPYPAALLRKLRPPPVVLESGERLKRDAALAIAPASRTAA